MRRLLLRIAAFLRPGAAERDLSRQVASDLQMYEDEFRRQGLSPEEARRQARLAFGGVEQVKERQRDARSLPLLDDLRQDLRYAFRSFVRTSGFSLVALITLALGIGANTAIFSVVNAVMLRPLPYPHSEQLVYVVEHTPPEVTVDDTPGRSLELIDKDYLEWRDQSQLMQSIAVYDNDERRTVGVNDEAIRLTGAVATPSLFTLLDVKPLLGAGFREAEADLAQTVLLSEPTWRRVFGSDPHILDRSITIDGASYRVAGVMPGTFHFPDRTTAFWLPIAPRVRDDGGFTFYRGIARLKEGVSLAAAQAEAARILKGVRGVYPAGSQPAGQARFELVRVQGEIVAPIRQACFALLAAVGFVLLIACANVANLILARNSTRHGEAAVRIALGAGRARLVRQMLTESTLLGLIGGVAGIAIAAGCVRLFGWIAPTDFPRADEIAIDRAVLIFAVALSAVTAVMLGILPALQVSRENPIVAIKAEAGSRSSRRDIGRSGLVVAEVAMATVLLVGGGLLLRSFQNLANVDPGFEAERLLVFQVALPRGPARALAITQSDSFRERLEALPGVTAVAFSNALPLRRRSGTYPGISGTPSTVKGTTDARVVSRNYFEAMKLRILQGRGFRDSDDAGQPMVILVNETFARHFADGAIGHMLTNVKTPAQIVGIVADTHESGMDQEVRPLVYIDARQQDLRWMQPTQALGWAFYAVRTAGDPTKLLPDVQRVLHDIIPAATIELDANSMTGIIAQSVSQRRFYAIVFGLFAALAVTLAAIGVYGVMAYAVTQRTREIGIRMALGAAGRDVIGLVLGQSLPLTALGVVLGLAAAFAVTRFLEGMLFGLTPLDPLTFAGVAVILGLTATLAALIPARRATRVDPLVALRVD